MDRRARRHRDAGRALLPQVQRNLRSRIAKPDHQRLLARVLRATSPGRRVHRLAFEALPPLDWGDDGRSLLSRRHYQRGRLVPPPLHGPVAGADRHAERPAFTVGRRLGRGDGRVVAHVRREDSAGIAVVVGGEVGRRDVLRKVVGERPAGQLRGGADGVKMQTRVACAPRVPCRHLTLEDHKGDPCLLQPRSGGEAGGAGADDRDEAAARAPLRLLWEESPDGIGGLPVGEGGPEGSRHE
mmetsp:Transcript_2890/g.8237  ORF Transcript_2890/g.8237 Transcript_2890/m.8237 type:complete len:241 (+) Transcript_2890:873-1595(+)